MANAHLGIGSLETGDDFFLDQIRGQSVGRKVVQRWPAVPTALNRMARTAMSRSALVGRGSLRCCHRVREIVAGETGSEIFGATSRPTQVFAGGADQAARVNRFTGIAATDDHLAEVGRCIAEILQHPFEQRLAGQCGERVFSDGFQITGLPHTSASK